MQRNILVLTLLFQVPEDNVEFHCALTFRTIISPRTRYECESIEWPSLPARSSAYEPIGVDNNLHRNSDAPGRFYFSVIPPFPRRQRHRGYRGRHFGEIVRPVTLHIWYMTAHEGSFSTIITVPALDIIKDVPDPRGGGVLQYATVVPIRYKIYSEIQ